MAFMGNYVSYLWHAGGERYVYLLHKKAFIFLLYLCPQGPILA